MWLVMAALACGALDECCYEKKYSSEEEFCHVRYSIGNARVIACRADQWLSRSVIDRELLLRL